MKKTTLFLLALTAIFQLFLACTKSGDVITPNSPPSSFNVTTKQTNTDLLVKWTKAKDPDGDVVTYTVVYKDTLARKISDTSYVIKNVPYASTIAGSIIAQDSKGAKTVVPFSVITNPNSPPTTFVITSKQTNTDLLLTWTKAKDPEGDLVNYTVVYKDTLARKISDTSYVLKNVPYASTITGSIIAKDSQGASRVVTFNIKTIDDLKTAYVLIPDINFERALIALNIDDIQDGKILKSSAEEVGYLYIMDKAISNLTGIEAFKNLTSLNCKNNQLTSLDVSKNVNLTKLYCFENRLTSLDVSKNISLTELVCESNKLTNIDVSKSINLTRLDCSANPLASLDISKSVNLTSLNCSYNTLASLDVSKNVNLTELECQSNNLTNLDVSKNIKLIGLNCWFNKLTNLDISKNVNLIQLRCGSNTLASIDVSKNINLEILYCWSNKLTSLDISKNIKLIYFSCYSNLLTSLDVSKNIKLVSINCTSNNIQTICVNSLSQPKSDWEKDATVTYKVCP